MSPLRWQRIDEIFHSALPLIAVERSAYVESACAGDSILQAQVESLLEADDSSGEFLQTAIFDVGLRIIARDGGATNVAERDVETDADLIGTVIDDRYRIDRELGQGGVGRVYLAHDQKLHSKRVVIKVLLEKSQTHRWLAQKFLQEKEALARVDHPGVVGILDAGELRGGKAYIVMQFIEGMSLRAAIAAQPEGLDLQRVASILKQAGSALSAVHEKKIFHRDLKPENIMLQRLARGEEQVKILDFGVAKVKESLIAPSTATGTVSAGTIAYMSPEQLRRDKVTAASDIYSLGLIAYEMVTGRRTFNPETEGRLADMQREGPRVKPSDLRLRLPRTAEIMILRALAFDPAERYHDAAKFGHELAAALTDEEDQLKPFLTTQTDSVSTTHQPLHQVERAAVQTPATMPTPFVHASVPTSSHQTAVAASIARKRLWPKLAIALTVVAFLALGGLLVMANRERLFSGASAAGPERALTYSLTVQKMRDGKKYEDPFQSSGQEIFENGYKFRLNVVSGDAGYLYIFNEGADQNGALSFTIIYPTPATSSGSAKIAANENFQTNWNEFGGKPGTEQFWMIWTAAPVTILESARDAAFAGHGRIPDAAMVRTVREFLTTHSDPKQETTKDTASKVTNVRGHGDVLVKLVELEHR